MPSYVLKRRKQVLAPNITTVGNPTIVDNVASGFATGTSYLTYPNVVDVNGNWEAVLKLRTEVTPPDSSILSFPNNNNFGCQLNVSGGKFLFVWNHIPGNRWDTYDTGVVIPVNKDVWVKYTKAGAIFKLYTSDDGLTYTEVASREYTATLYTPNTGFSLGGAVNNQVAWNGSIDLNESYIKINSELWWSGTHYVAENTSYILKRKPYMKYVYNDWQQPVLTANGTMGGDSFAVSASSEYSGWSAFKAFDGVLTGKNGWSASSNSYPQHLIFYNPVDILVKKLTIVNYYQDNIAFTAGNVYGSNDGSSWTLITSYTNDNTSSGASWDIVLDENKTPYKYHKFEITNGKFISTNLIKCTEILITAQEVIAVSGTPSDYNHIGEAKSYALNRIKYRDVPNVTVVGSPTIVDNVASGFSASDYVTMPVSIPTYGYELVFGMQTGSDVTTRQAILGSTANDNSFMLCIRGGEFILIDKISGVSEGNCIALGGTVTANTTYLMKIVNTGTKAATPTELHYSTDNGATFTLACTIAGQDTPWLNPCPFGIPSSRDSTKAAFTGSIDFTNAYLKSGDEVVWSGVKAEKY